MPDMRTQDDRSQGEGHPGVTPHPAAPLLVMYLVMYLIMYLVMYLLARAVARLPPLIHLFKVLQFLHVQRHTRYSLSNVCTGACARVFVSLCLSLPQTFSSRAKADL